MRLALIGDAQSPHLLKWARALASTGEVELWVASSREFAAGFDAVVPVERRLALSTSPTHAGGNVAVLRKLPRLARWLRQVDADWVNPHYLTSHGTLAWLAKTLCRLRGRLVGSAWGSDILVTPLRSPVHRWLTQRVLRACTLTTSDSSHMADAMRSLGAREVMTIPFGLEAMPNSTLEKKPWLFFANRALEPLYRPQRVLEVFAAIAAARSEAQMLVANDGSLADRMPEVARALGLRVGAVARGDQVEFVGRLDADRQDRCYAAATWYLSLPKSDSVSVSVLEAMAHGCIPMLSDLPANRELIDDSRDGLIVGEFASFDPARLLPLAANAKAIAAANREWIARNALVAPGVAGLVARLGELTNSP